MGPDFFPYRVGCRDEWVQIFFLMGWAAGRRGAIYKVLKVSEDSKNNNIRRNL
jgi:hypothetical protein